MYGQERAVNVVSADAIVGAVTVERRLDVNQPQFQEFRARRYEANPRYGRSAEVRRQVFRQFHLFILGSENQWSRSPTRSSGLVTSTRT
jgi:hypothetical protein